ncbi:GIY-YIG nuclease family protein [Bacillus thuringiensis]|uniref:GIY-YIG nuclease family protein n=1 Tax=Bacillus thuringiensis TaxID=1428 RepID=UPI0021D65028|nr:GIY-YIG nuclease family protein [Bacillus thuringiensis]MCU7667278.1 GIY-YIG nuclease family protein [Bacillus thuringiensis]
MNFNTMSPYELGENKSKESLPHLIVYLHNGSDNDKRLAASAIIKLMNADINCYSALPFLLKNIKSSKPQVRQYTLKALREFTIPSEYYGEITEIYMEDEKEYNKLLAEEILKQFNINEPMDSPVLHKSHISNDSIDTKHNDTEPASESSERGYVYFIKEDYAGRIKIGKTKDINQRLDTFNVKLPFHVDLLHVIESNNYHYTEKLFHILFQAKRVNGEWFELNETDITWIKSGKYTQRIMQSITTIKKREETTKSKDTHIPITQKQISFLSSLLENSRLILTKPISNLSATDAASLIGYLYKGEQLPKHLIGTIQSKRYFHIN